MNCIACKDDGYRDLPERDGSWVSYPCPVCKPWAQGFPGERIGDHYIILPAKPGEPAVYVGAKPRNTLQTN